MNYEKLQSLTFKLMCMCGLLLILCKIIMISVRFNVADSERTSLQFLTTMEPYTTLLQQMTYLTENLIQPFTLAWVGSSICLVLSQKNER